MCDCLVALAPATRTGVALFAKNSDRPPTESQDLVWFPARRDDGPVRATYVDVPAHQRDTIGVLGSQPRWLWGIEHGVNEAGVTAGNETIYTTLDPRGAPPALLGMDLVRLALERAENAPAAVEVITTLLERHGQGGSGHEGVDRPYWSSFLIADPSSAWVIETSGRTWAAEEVERTRAISNRTTIPSFDAEHRHPRQPVEALVDPRWRASQAVLAAGPVSVDGVKTHLRSHVDPATDTATDEGAGYTVCMHVPDVEATTASVVAELPSAGRPLARMLLGSPCASVYVPLYVGRDLGAPPPWERFAALGESHRPELDALEAGLEVDARDDDAWAAEAWGRVTQLLDRLGV